MIQMIVNLSLYHRIQHHELSNPATIRFRAMVNFIYFGKVTGKDIHHGKQNEPGWPKPETSLIRCLDIRY